MRKIKISAGFEGVIPTGSYQNSRPSFRAEEEFDVDTDSTDSVDEIISTRQRELQAICYQNFESEAQRARIAKIQSDRKDFHWYTLPNGESVPSVSSILNYDSDFLVAEDELKQYAAQGNIIHAQVFEFIKTGKWKLPQEIEGLSPDLFIIKSGSLGLSLDGWDFRGFLEKFPMEKLENGTPVISVEHRFGGTPDGYCVYNGLPTVFDVKRTPDKVKHFQQVAAYAKASGRDIKQMVLIPLNDKTERGFSKPLVSTDVDKYFELFLYKRKEFLKVYGI